MNSSPIRILLVDDEVDTLDFLSYILKKENFEVRTAINGVEATSQLKDFKPDLILLDYMMPGMDGLEFFNFFKKNYSSWNTLVAFLTAKNEDETQIELLDYGADDFISKPIKPLVLLSRIRALLRRKSDLQELQSHDIITIGDLVINPEAFNVVFKGEQLDFPRKEFQLLYLLASMPGKVYKREILLREIWGEEVLVGERTVDVHIRKIREKLNDQYLKTIKGVGYKFEF
ncbi:MAG: response regulator transcription factor [Saprospiraceae bacterium]|nr:response regulator transcription factor [Saprospiraceae bacterium]